MSFIPNTTTNIADVCEYHGLIYCANHLIERHALEYLLNHRPNEKYCVNCVHEAHNKVYGPRTIFTAPIQDIPSIQDHYENYPFRGEPEGAVCFEHMEYGTLAQNDKVYCYKCILKNNNLPEDAMEDKSPTLFNYVKIGKEI